MIIHINGSSSGWGEYVTKGTKYKPRDKTKIKVLRGDTDFGDIITNSGHWKQNSYSIILAFKGHINEKVLIEALNDFETLFMHGFEQSEYHLDAVLHSDTDDDHIHVRIPKMNLKTGTQLRLYMHSVDKQRLELIRDYIDIRLNLASPKNNKKLIENESNEYLDQWRQGNNQNTITLDTKKGRKEAEHSINNYILELHQANIIETFDNVKKALKGMNLEIIKFGYDKPKDFYYATVSNGAVKLRIKGDIYSEQFWKFSRTDREEQIRDNKQSRGSYTRSESAFEKVHTELARVLEKRREIVDKRYKSSRERARKESNTIIQSSGESNFRAGGKVSEKRQERSQTSSFHNQSNSTNSIVSTNTNQRDVNVASASSVQVHNNRGEELSEVQNRADHQGRFWGQIHINQGVKHDGIGTDIIGRISKEREKREAIQRTTAENSKRLLDEIGHNIQEYAKRIVESTTRRIYAWVTAGVEKYGSKIDWLRESIETKIEQKIENELFERKNNLEKLKQIFVSESVNWRKIETENIKSILYTEIDVITDDFISKALYTINVERDFYNGKNIVENSMEDFAQIVAP